MGLALLAAYPLATGILIAIDRRHAVGLTMTQVDLVRLVSGLASFVGFAVLIGEYQSWKQTRKEKSHGGANPTSHGTAPPHRP